MSKKQVKPAKTKRVKTVEDMELVLYVPQDLAQGDPGDPLHPLVIEQLNRLAVAGWWPSSFGEDGPEVSPGSVELWLIYSADFHTAIEYTRTFIAKGGE